MKPARRNDIRWTREFQGVFQGNSPENIPFGSFTDALDFEIYPNGQIAPRMGYSRYSDGAAPDGNEVRTVFFANFDGTVRTLVATDDNIYEVASDGTWSLITTVATPGKRMCFTMMNEAAAPIVVWGNGEIQPQKWDGTTVTDLGPEAPKGRPISWKNYLIFFNIKNAPGRVQFAIDPGDPDTFIDAGLSEHFIEVIGAVTSVFIYGTPIIFTAERAEVYRGEPDQLTGSDVLSTTIGCVSHESVTNAAGYLCWVSQAGPMIWDGGGIFPMDNLGNPTDLNNSNIQTDVKNISYSDTTYISAAYFSLEKRYFFSAKIQPVAGGDKFYRTWVYDFPRRAWMPWSLATTAIATGMPAGKSSEKVYVGRPDGAVLQSVRGMLTGDFVDEGAVDADNEEYEYFISSGAHDMEYPDDEKIFRRFWFVASFVEGDENPGERMLQVEYYGDFASVAQTNNTLTTSERGFILNVNRLADENDPTTFDEARLNDVERGVYREPFVMRAKHMRFKIYGQGRDTAVALSRLAIEFRPVVRRYLRIP